MAEAFIGYLLPWGQMSFWGAQVIVNLFSPVPSSVPDLWIHPWRLRGRRRTLNRFFSFHVIAVPLVLLGLVAAPSWRCTKSAPTTRTASRSRRTKDPKRHPLDGIPFHPYYTVKDIVGVVGGSLMVFSASCSSRRRRRLLPGVQQLHPGRPAEDPAAHRAGLVLSRRSTRSCVRSPGPLFGIDAKFWGSPWAPRW